MMDKERILRGIVRGKSYSVKEAAYLAGVGFNTLSRWISEGKLRATGPKAMDTVNGDNLYNFVQSDYGSK